MKAWVLHEINDLRFEDVDSPTPGEGEVLVKVKAAGICSSDFQRVYHTGAYHYPIILGHEFSGVTPIGKRVSVFPLIPCFTCDSCGQKRYETCSNYSYIGSRQDGAFAEFVAVPEWNLIELPDIVTFEEAVLLEPAAVALHAVKKVDLRNARSAVVIGNGAVGKLIAKWLAIFGVATVDILGRNDRASLEYYDVCIEAVGSTDTFCLAIELVMSNGQIVLVGNPNVDFNIDQKWYWKILRKQLSVIGSWNSSYQTDWQAVIDNTDVLQLNHFISHQYKFEELNKAFEMMRDKKEKHSKIIAVWE